MALKEKLHKQLDGLSWRNRIHAINRIYEILRLTHNKMGDVYMKRSKLLEFQTIYPSAWSKLETTLLPSVEGDYIIDSGWKTFKEQSFDGMHDAVAKYRADVMAELRSMNPSDFQTLVKDKIILVTEDVVVENKEVLRNSVSAFEFNPYEA